MQNDFYKQTPNSDSQMSMYIKAVCVRDSFEPFTKNVLTNGL